MAGYGGSGKLRIGFFHRQGGDKRRGKGERESEHVGSYNDSSLQQPAKDEGRWQGAAKGGRVG